MAGPRGYHNYRGRNSKGKAVLAVVLVLGCAAARVFLLAPDQNRVIGTNDPQGTQQQEQPNQSWRRGDFCWANL